MLDGSYSISDNHNYFEYNIMKHKKLTDKPLVEMHINGIHNNVTLNFKFEFYLELLMSETLKLLGNAIENLTKEIKCDNLPHIEKHEGVFSQCNIVNNKCNFWLLSIFNPSPRDIWQNKQKRNIMRYSIEPRNEIWVKCDGFL